MAQRTKLDSLDIPISDSWRRLIIFAKHEIPRGEISIEIVNGEPTKLVNFKRRIRFDKPEDVDFLVRTEEEA